VTEAGPAVDPSLFPAALRLGVYELDLHVREPVRLADFSAATLRGAFAWSFKRMVCYQPQVKTCSGCLLRVQCPYPSIFEPMPQAGTLYEGLQNVPAPYVLRPPPEDRHDYAPGEHLVFQIVLVGRAIGLLPYFAVALQQLEVLGLGHSRGKVQVATLTARGPSGEAPQVLYSSETPGVIHNHWGWPAAVWVQSVDVPAQVTVDFVTPVRLKSEGRLHTRPEFHVLYRALLRRASALNTCYGEEPWETDFAGLAGAARSVGLVAATTQSTWRSRYSSRQARDVDLLGCEGQVAYAGDLRPYWPLLQLGEVMHVGKSSTFGLGRYVLRW
jgi:hypothetical protein